MNEGTRSCVECGRENALDASRCVRCGAEQGGEEVDRRLVGQVFGPYRLEEPRRKTPLGTAFLATDEGSGRVVEVQVLSLVGASPAVRERWRRAAGQRLVHPNLVRVVEAGESGDHGYIATDAGAGEAPLSSFPPLAPGRVRSVARDLARALASLHGHGILHRAISPASVLVDESTLSVRLTDLGLATAVDGEDVSPGVTGSSEVLGDPIYTAPEASGRVASIASDLYALGATLGYAVTGRPPFGPSREGRRALGPAELPGLDPDLAALVAELTEPDPERRPPSAAQIETRLSNAERGTRSAEREGRIDRPSGRRLKIVLSDYFEEVGPAPPEPSTLDLLPLPVAQAVLAAWPPGGARMKEAFLLWSTTSGIRRGTRRIPEG